MYYNAIECHVPAQNITTWQQNRTCRDGVSGNGRTLPRRPERAATSRRTSGWVGGGGSLRSRNHCPTDLKAGEAMSLALARRPPPQHAPHPQATCPSKDTVEGHPAKLSSQKSLQRHRSGTFGKTFKPKVPPRTRWRDIRQNEGRGMARAYAHTMPRPTPGHPDAHQRDESLTSARWCPCGAGTPPYPDAPPCASHRTRPCRHHCRSPRQHRSWPARQPPPHARTQPHP